MINIKALLEASNSRVGHLTFMRANPPTIGHAKVVDSVLGQKEGVKRIYLSHSQDTSKNPLSGNEKLEYFRKMYPNHKHMFRTSNKEEPTIFHAAARMHKEGVEHLHLHVGQDRAEELKKKLNHYNGKFDKDGNGYNFKSITIHSAGNRDPDAEGAEGMSATKMREAAVKGDKKTFRTGLHHNLTNDDSNEMMSKIKERLSGKTAKKTLKSLKEVVEVDVKKKGRHSTYYKNEQEIIYDKGKHISTTKSGHLVYHTSYHDTPTKVRHEYHAVNPETKKVDISIEADERKNVLSNILLQANAGNTIKAHDFYHHLITKHDKVLSHDVLSPGGKAVVKKLNTKYHRSVATHGWLHGKPVNVTDKDDDQVYGPEGDSRDVDDMKLISHKK